ncbi:hypothetical protein TWF102_005875 [Orbilia oligospora]|uniref:F-box domain-containing protein n=1 Tax=Orbilia oligospora TaxID=2813651 RepID=A0A7C8NMW0_ORBOL|nr:hypothetical protein TWF103_003582 [Orbilia oligospora]KAF3112136.1 hypothetical protein TWF102_005875 [Orbilia oligospora]KAF3148034.1 hypothetical protein TWF594_001958 [Orbilia oligospora]
MPSMSLSCIPLEILIQIASYLRISDLSSFARCCQKIKGACIPILYRHVELRLYGQKRRLIGKLFPFTLLRVESLEYFAETRSLAIIGCDHHFGMDKEDDRDTLVLNGREKPIVVPLQRFVERIPSGKLRSFELKVDFPIIGEFFIGLITMQPNLVKLYLSFKNTTQEVTAESISKVNLPNLKSLTLAEIYKQSDVLLLNQILGSASKLDLIDLSWHLHYPDVNRSSHQGAFTQILQHRPKTLKIANIDMTPQLLEATGVVEELHLREVNVPRDRDLQYIYQNPYSSISLKKLLITTIPDLRVFYEQQILDKLAPGLEELHVTVNHMDRDGEAEVRDNIPIPLEYVNRHSGTLKYLSLFEKTSEGNLFIDGGAICQDEIEVFKHCKLDEFATAINFYCQIRTPAYWKTFEMSPADVNYAHFSCLTKLYIIPDMISLNTQIENDQDEFWDLNPRNIFSYQMASMILTNIGLYAESIPRLEFLIVGMGNAYCGQKVFVVTWEKHGPPYRKGAKQRKVRYLYTLSPPYEMEDFRDQGIVFKCFEGTKFTSEEDRKWISI